MRKILTFLMILSVSVLLFACQGQDTMTQTAAGTETNTEQNTVPKNTQALPPVQDTETEDPVFTEDDETETKTPSANPVTSYSVTSIARNDANLVPKSVSNELIEYKWNVISSLDSVSENRKAVEQSMREMVTVLWRADRDYSWPYSVTGTGVNLSIAANQLYMGLPYTHGGGSLYSFSQFFTSQENGVYNLGALPEGWANALSNDCADCVFWAWAKVSTSIDFTYTREMTPSHGCLHVGEYTAPDPLLSETKAVCQENGTQVMYEAYAKAQRGDAVVHYNNNSGHAMMIVNVRVIRDTDGKINGATSYVTVHQQRSSPVTVTTVNGETCYQPCGNDNFFSFEKLYSTGFLPVTCAELRDNTAPVAATFTDSVSAGEMDASKLTAGTITTNYRPSSVTIKISDANGNVVQDATRYSRQSAIYQCLLSSFATVAVPDTGVINSSLLTTGETYHCTVTCQVSTGEILTVRDFNFTA